ncbi:MAG: hypothetical protein LBU65_11840, partial [Planctomycetaceae bacterium]|nr:hypothetical protein [Planctomycetaceae bacterium]
MAEKKKMTVDDIKKYAFWACVALVVLIGFLANSVAVSNVSKDFNDTKSDLETQKSAVEKLRSNTQHPNQRTITEVVKLTNE